MAQELSFEDFQRRRHILALDGLRALSILGVLLHHTRGQPFGMFHGFRGVWVFFVLSGFLITTLALREEARNGRLDIRGFMIRRVFRILPLYYLALIAYLIFVFVLDQDTNAARFEHHLWNFFFYTPEFPIFKYHFQIPFGQSWSLGIEEKFYLIWPFLAFGVLAHSRFRLVATVGLIAIACGLTAHGGYLAQMWGSYADILIGCLVAQLLHKKATYEWLAILGRTSLAWAVLLLLGLGTLWSGTGTQLGQRLFSMVAAFAVIALVTNRSGPANLMSMPWLVRIGVWSYAIYLTHTIAFHIVNALVPKGSVGNILTLFAMLAIDLPIVALLHVYVEKPLIALGRRLAARKPAPAPVSQNILEARDSTG